MTWIGFTAESTVHDILAAGYIMLPEPSPVEQPDGTLLVAVKDQSGVWSSEWMSEDDYAAVESHRRTEHQVRMSRAQLLKGSDWTQGKDIPNNISSAWAPYRQALRDITTQEGFPLAVIWPTAPQ
jgi:hypothetical protein